MYDKGGWGDSKAKLRPKLTLVSRIFWTKCQCQKRAICKFSSDRSEIESAWAQVALIYESSTFIQFIDLGDASKM